MISRVVAILLSAHKLSMAFAGRTLFKDLSFGIETGDRIGLIGPNGAGKSTLLKIISGRTHADKGTLSTQQGLNVAYLEQNPVLDPAATVIDTIMSGAADPHDWQSISQAQELLSHLYFEEAGISHDSLIGELSGGWKKKTAFARECLKNPVLMLLDEPTNHLDVESILWLEEYLAKAPFATLTVTHDRLFLNRISNKIWELDFRNPNGLLVVEGDFVDYCEVKENLLNALERQETTMRNTLRRETEWLRRGPKARTTKQTARINRAGELKDDVADLAELNRKREVKLDFVAAEKNPKKLIEAKNLGKSYDGRTIIKDLNLFLGPGNKIGILGINGAGKSTLLRLLLGLEKSDTGSLYLADDLEVAYFEQNRESLDQNASVVQSVCPSGDHVKFNGNYVHVRSYLDRFLFPADKMTMPVAKLSGGEQSRLLIARLMLKEANLLVLDEPTNDLDMVTLNILEDRLKEFLGAVLIVTHDRYFMHRVATNILAIDQKFDPGRVESFAELEQWEAWQKRQIEQQKSGEKEKPKSNAAPVKNVDRKKLTFKDQHELDQMEAKLYSLEKKMESLVAESSDEKNVSNGTLMAEIYKKISAAQTEIDTLYARWSELESLTKD